MNFAQLVDRLVAETTQVSLGWFAPELVLCATILVLLLVRLFGADRWLPGYLTALAGGVIAFLFSFAQFVELRGADPDQARQLIFTGLLVVDKLTVFFNLFLTLFLVFVVVLTVFTGIPDTDDAPEFYSLLIGSAIGMMLMGSANNLLMIFLGVEMASVPSYALVGFLKGRRESSEAALKFVVYGAGAAGVLLYGTSLLAGILGTADMGLLAERFAILTATEGTAGIANPTVLAVMLGLLMVLIGLAFKLSLVPFHFWCPDAFEGASAEVAGYLSIASKGAAFVLLVRVCLAFTGGNVGMTGELLQALGIGLGVIAIVTTTLGNLAAYSQTNVKRLLAYSTIAHAGSMLLAVSAMVVALSGSAVEIDTRSIAVDGLSALLYYLFVYLFMNLGAFSVVALLRNQIFSEELRDYAGLARQAPVLCVCMLICCFSLIGLPPFGGFIGKFLVFRVVYESGAIHPMMYVFLVLAGLNTVLSLFYYLKILKAMFLTERDSTAQRVLLPTTSGTSFYVMIVSLPVIVLGMVIAPLSETAIRVAESVLP